MRRDEDVKRASALAVEHAARSKAIEAYVCRLPEATWKGTRTALAKALGGRTQTALATIGELVSLGRLTETLSRRKTTEALRWVR